MEAHPRIQATGLHTTVDLEIRDEAIALASIPHPSLANYSNVLNERQQQEEQIMEDQAQEAQRLEVETKPSTTEALQGIIETQDYRDSTLLLLFLPFFTFSLTRPSLLLYLFIFLLILSIPMQWLSHTLDLPSFPVHIAFFHLPSYFLCIPVW